MKPIASHVKLPQLNIPTRLRSHGTRARRSFRVSCSVTTHNFISPTKLLSSSTTDAAEDSMAFTLQLVTGSRRGAGVSEPHAGVRVALIDVDGNAFLQYIPRHNASSSRFEAGNVDSVVVEAPNLGRVEAIWVAPESGTWFLEEVALKERGGAADADAVRFPCSRTLGVDDCPAAELRPQVTVTRTPEEVQSMVERGMEEYAELKKRLLITNVELVIAGTLACAGLLGIAYAKAFAGGGVVGLLYIYLLEKQVDSLAPTESSPKNVLIGSMVSSPLRLIMLGGLGVAAAKGTGLSILSDAVETGATDPRDLVLTGALGFFMYKVAVLLTASQTADVDPQE